MNAQTAIHCIGAALLGGALLLPAACSAPPSNSRTKGTLPGPDTFKPVANMMGAHCGSLDCHGSPARNMRIYSWAGLRMAPDYPGEYDQNKAPVPLTEAEYQATYYAVVTIEPEILGQVLAQHGADPERLTLVRKAHGTEYHKGHVAIPPGSDADHCLLSWLAGNLDTTACNKSSLIAPPKGF